MAPRRVHRTCYRWDARCRSGMPSRRRPTGTVVARARSQGSGDRRADRIRRGHRCTRSRSSTTAAAPVAPDHPDRSRPLRRDRRPGFRCRLGRRAPERLAWATSQPGSLTRPRSRPASTLCQRASNRLRSAGNRHPLRSSNRHTSAASRQRDRSAADGHTPADRPDRRVRCCARRRALWGSSCRHPAADAEGTPTCRLRCRCPCRARPSGQMRPACPPYILRRTAEPAKAAAPAAARSRYPPRPVVGATLAACNTPR